MDREKAVAVAYDVLKHLTTLKISNYCYLYSNKFKFNEESDLTNQAILDLYAQDCDVCAVGACFLSAIRLYNLDYSVFMAYVIDGTFLDGTFKDINKQLYHIFGSESLCLIEVAFAGNNGCIYRYDPPRPSAIQILKAEQCYQKKPDTERLRLIMENVISNNGIFCP